MPTVSLSDLRAWVRERADVVSDLFVTDATDSLDRLIDASLRELYDILLAADADRYLTVSAPVVVASGSSTIDVTSALGGSGMMRWSGLERSMGGGEYRDVPRGVFRERNSYTDLRYLLGDVGGNATVRLFPTGLAPGTYRIWYTPPVASIESNNFDGINGWEEYVVVDVAIKIRQKEEADARDLMLSKGALLARIQAMGRRDAGEPPRIADVHTEEPDLPWY